MYYDGTNVIIYGFSNGGSYNTVFSPVSSISWTWANIGNGGNVISMAYIRNGTGKTAFYGSGNMSSITRMTGNPSVGVQVCFHSSILNKWFIADMSNTTSTCYLSQNLQGDFGSWNNGGTGVGTFYYTQQYSQKMTTFFILLSLELRTWFAHMLLSILQVQHTIPQR